MDKITKTVRAGAITYFLDIKKTNSNKPYLMLTESQYKGEKEKRDRSTIIVFQEYAKEFITPSLK